VPEQDIRIMVYTPHELGEDRTIPNHHSAMKAVIGGGYLEAAAVPHTRGLYLICDMDGKDKNLPDNRCIGFDTICGTFFVTRVNGEGDNISLTDNDVALLREILP
jgi:hypothetical protein